MNTYAVIDFETTGLSPAHGARPTEIAVVMVQGDRIVDRYQSLMNPGVPIPAFIQSLTGITNQMVKSAPGVQEVMQEAANFVGDTPLVAHNAAFDRKFWDDCCRNNGTFICSLLLARRLFPDAPNHKLATLVQSLGLPATGRYHRALADAEATAYLLLHMQQELIRRFGLSSVGHDLLMAIQKVSRKKLEQCVQRYR
jgi:DNA polymerase-3 subunit epsilon